MRRELVCLEPASPPRLQVRTSTLPEPRSGQVLVRVEATSVNPIDAKRAGGYGRRLLGLRGAARFRLVLGNDLAGRVEAVGPGVSTLAPGRRVFGLWGTGKGGGAICGVGMADDCRALGARHVVEQGTEAIRGLPADFDAVLNFASWDDEPALASRLQGKAMGHATAVHPLRGHFDTLGWVRGALASRRDFDALRPAVRRQSPDARYAWAIFQPDREALAALGAGVRERRFWLPIGSSVGLERAHDAFANVAAGNEGRAVQLP